MSLRKRSQARVLALQALCICDALGELPEGDLAAFLRDPLNYADLGWEQPPGPELLAFAEALVRGAWRCRDRCDDLLRRNVAGWSIERMQPVDRNILRLGLYELLESPGTPHPVVISEAVELARRFGGAESPAFVNGVLDGLRRRLLAPAACSAEAAPAPGPAAPPAENGTATEAQG